VQSIHWRQIVASCKLDGVPGDFRRRVHATHGGLRKCIQKPDLSEVAVKAGSGEGFRAAGTR
jgi:hypothetical protein